MILIHSVACGARIVPRRVGKSGTATPVNNGYGPDVVTIIHRDPPTVLLGPPRYSVSETSPCWAHGKGSPSLSRGLRWGPQYPRRVERPQ